MVRFGLALLSGVLAAGAASALTIDDFSLDQDRLEAAFGVSESNQETNNGSFVGPVGTSTRTMAVVGDGNPPPSSQYTSAEIGGGVFEFAAGVGVEGSASLTYSSLGGIDLSDYVGFNFHDLSADHVFDYDITISDDLGGSSVLSGTFSLPTPISNVTTSVSFADFVGTVDMTSVDELIFALGVGASTTNDALDFNMSRISAAIPLPAAGFFLLTALGGLGLLSARRAYT